VSRQPPIRHRTATGDRFVAGFLIGDYRIEREVRHEDTGMVYGAVHLVLPRIAAVKVMHPSQLWMRSLAVQILREGCILEALSHPGVPRVFECGVLSDKRPWVAMELVEGASITELANDGPLAISDLVVALRTVADVLEHAHARGVVHHRLTESVVVRTPKRQSPFSVRGWGDVVTHDSASLAAEPSSDIYALGEIALRALTGAPPPVGASAQALHPSAPAELTALIDEMLAPAPSARPTATDVRDRATWLAETLELPRTESAPKPIRDDPSGMFNIRIHRGSSV
jgi:serine/threonine protein kinase